MDTATPSTAAKMPTAGEAAQLFVFTAQKAGMQGIDKAHVQKVVFEMSKDSAFFQNSMRQNAKVEARIAEMQSKLEGLTPARRETLRRQIDQMIAAMEAQRELQRTKVVVDMDMFYAAVEMRDNPALRGKPVAVGGMSMLSTTNYEARKYGVPRARSAAL
ncbi:hypothetical protein ATCC90586_012001 [Pythium insidiosum]|nr:hypothetical protein ATCC90586_012001 [Pythium insidiosum]